MKQKNVLRTSSRQLLDAFGPQASWHLADAQSQSIRTIRAAAQYTVIKCGEEALCVDGSLRAHTPLAGLNTKK